MSSLLDEAIVDAKALREAVLKSAEASLLETYSPRIQEAVEQMLEQEDPLGLGGMGMEDPLGAGPMGSPVGEEGEETEAVFDKGETEVLPEDLMQAVFDPEEEEIDFKIPAKELKQMMESALREAKEAEIEDDEFVTSIEQTIKKIGEDLPSPIDEEAEFELSEELINVFEGEGRGGPTEHVVKSGETLSGIAEEYGVSVDYLVGYQLKKGKDIDPDPNKIQIGQVILIPSEEPGPEEEYKKMGREHMSDTKKEGLEITEENIEEIVESLVVDLMPKKSGWAGTPESVMQHNEELAAAMAESDEYKEQKEELLKVGKELAESNKRFQSVNTKLMESVETFKQKLDEVNLANAKLLYTNRILRRSSLNERQKETIAEALSSAGSVSEAKVIFETLQSTVGSSHKRNPQSLSEAVSRPSMMLPRNKAKNTDVNPFADRMRILAGINKK